MIKTRDRTLYVALMEDSTAVIGASLRLYLSGVPSDASINKKSLATQSQRLYRENRDRIDAIVALMGANDEPAQQGDN